MYGNPKSMIATKTEMKLQEAKIAHGIMKLIKSRNNTTKEIEDLLAVWIKKMCW